MTSAQSISSNHQAVELQPFPQSTSSASVAIPGSEGSCLELQIFEISSGSYNLCHHTWTAKEITQITCLAKQTSSLPLNIQIFHDQSVHSIQGARLIYSTKSGWKIVHGQGTSIKKYLQNNKTVSSSAKQTLMTLESTLNGEEKVQRQLIELVISMKGQDREPQLSRLLEQGVNLNIGRLGPLSPIGSTLLGLFDHNENKSLGEVHLQPCNDHSTCVRYTKYPPLCNSMLQSGDFSVVDLAILIGNLSSLKVLLKHGFDFNSVHFGTVFKLNLKGPNNINSVITLLLQYNLPPDTEIEESLPLQHWACFRNDLCLLELLIEKHGCDVNQRSSLEATPLMSAMRHPSARVINYLVGRNADIDACSAKLDNDTALHILARLEPQDWSDDLIILFADFIIGKPERLLKLNNKSESPFSLMVERKSLKPLINLIRMDVYHKLEMPQQQLNKLLRQAVELNNLELFNLLLYFNPQFNSQEYQQEGLVDNIIKKGSSNCVALTLVHLKQQNQALHYSYHQRVQDILSNEIQSDIYTCAVWLECFNFIDKSFIERHPSVRESVERMYQTLLVSGQPDNLNKLTSLARERFASNPINFLDLLNQFIGNITSAQVHINCSQIEGLVNHIRTQKLVQCDLEKLLTKMLETIQNPPRGYTMEPQLAIKAIDILQDLIATKHNGKIPQKCCQELTEFLKNKPRFPILTSQILYQCHQFLNQQQILFQELAVHALKNQEFCEFKILIELVEQCEIDLNSVLKTQVSQRQTIGKLLASNRKGQSRQTIQEIDILIFKISVANKRIPKPTLLDMPLQFVVTNPSEDYDREEEEFEEVLLFQ